MKEIIAVGTRGASIFKQAMWAKSLEIKDLEGWRYAEFLQRYAEKIRNLPKRKIFETAQDIAALKVESALAYLHLQPGTDTDIYGFHSVAISMTGEEIPNFRSRDDFKTTVSGLNGNPFTYLVALAYGSVGSGGSGRLHSLRSTFRSTGLVVKIPTDFSDHIAEMTDEEAVEASLGFRPMTNRHSEPVIALVRYTRAVFFDNIRRAIEECGGA